VKLLHVFFTAVFLTLIFLCNDVRLAVASGAHALVDLATINPRIVLDIKYATTDNFTGQQIYPAPRCFLLKPVAQALNAMQKELEVEGLGLKVFDGWRPMAAQRLMWKIQLDKFNGDVEKTQKFVSPPSKGGRHTRGTAVDLTIINTRTGKEVAMPTPFDSFDKKASPRATVRDGLTSLQIKNREKLADIAARHGFIRHHPSEWWHKDYRGWDSKKADGSDVYPPREETFEELAASGDRP
jgi:zinc D-Ala-D-Ala dipeptidase